MAGTLKAVGVRPLLCNYRWLYPTVLLIPLTTQLGTLRFPGTVLIAKTPENGLRQDSVALVFQLAATDKRSLAGALGVIVDEVMEQVWRRLDELTGRTQP